MWQCKVCGKKFNKEPVYCSYCGATDDFLTVSDPKDSEDFYKEVENNFNSPVSNKTFQDYDSMIKDFMSDEYVPVSTKVKEPFEDEMKLKAEKRAREEKLNKIDQEYYESIKTVVGADGIEKEDYYESLEDMFKEPINAQDETTFNGLFKKEDTMENTFLKPKQKEKRVKNQTFQVGNSDRKKLINLPAWSLAPKKKSDDLKKDNEKSNKKLIKILAGLLGLFVFMLFFMSFLVNQIVKSGDGKTDLPSKETMEGFFTTIKGMDQNTFLTSTDDLISFVGYEGNLEEKKTQLTELHAMVTSPDFKVNGVKDITGKGSNRILVEYNLTGSKIAVDTFDQLVFRASDVGTYLLEFSDYVAQVTIAKAENENK